MEDNFFSNNVNKRREKKVENPLAPDGKAKASNENLQKINYEALAIYKTATEEDPNANFQDIAIYEDTTLQNGDLKYPHYTGTVYQITKIENRNGQDIEVTEIYKSMYDPATQEFKPVKMAINDEKGLRLTEEYKQLLENQYRYGLQEANELDFALMIQDITTENLGLTIQEPSLDLIELPELNAELEFFDPAKILEEYQLQMQEQENELDFEKNIKELPENEDQDLANIANGAGLSFNSIKFSTKIDPKEPVAEGRSFEGEMGIEGEYKTIYATVINGTFAFYGIKKETGEPEVISNCSPTTQGERNIPLMDETGDIEKKQVRAIFKVDRARAFALNIEPGSGKMNVYYCARGDQENEYFGKSIGTDKQTRSIGAVDRFMGVEVMGQADNRYDTVNEAYEQLEETSSTNRTLIDENEANDVIYYDVDEPIKMHDGTQTTIAKEAQNTEKFENNLQGYITELEDAEGKCLSEKIESMREKVIEEERDIGEELEAKRLEELRRQEQYAAMEEAKRNSN